MSTHWNVANSVLTNRFIQPLPLPWKLALIVAFGVCGAILTMKLRALPAMFSVGVLALAYGGTACWLFVAWRCWLPIVLPVGGSLLITHGCMVTYRVRHEQRERQIIKNVFSKMVSPSVMHELLAQPELALSGARRHLTVLFADVRGFTEITDAHQRRAEAEVEVWRVNEAEARQFYDREATEVLQTVNAYLGVAAHCIEQHDGTLDKYIGDCVMAFWGAPMRNPGHAVSCVRAAIELQRAVFALNQQRRVENARREAENIRRAIQAEQPLPLLDILTLGTGINTGMMTVGLMGSEDRLDYTVFGREVNLAARLEAASGCARILIGEQTYLELQRDDPELAAACLEQPPLSLKGFRHSVKAFEVRWRSAEISPDDAGQSMTIVRRTELRDAAS